MPLGQLNFAPLVITDREVGGEMATTGMTAIQLYILPRKKNMGGCRKKGNPCELPHEEKSKVRIRGWGKRYKQKTEVGSQERENSKSEKQRQ